MAAVLLTGLVATCVTSLALPIVYRILVRRGILDYPTGRSSHGLPTPRGGGAAQTVGVGAAWATLGLAPGLGILGALGFGLLGLVDDFRSQRPSLRLVGQLLLAAFTVNAVIVDTGDLIARALTLLCGVVFVTFIVNATNFMDGLNGMSALHGLSLGATYFILLIGTSSDWSSIAAIVVGISLAFLPWNMRARNRMFLGDSGSYLLGALFALLAIAAWESGFSVLVSLAPLTIYVVDVGWTLILRSFRRRSPFVAHRGHVYQRISDQGLSHVQSSIVVTLFTLAACGIAVALSSKVLNVTIAGVLLSMLAITYVSVPTLCRQIMLENRNRTPEN